MVRAMRDQNANSCVRRVEVVLLQVADEIPQHAGLELPRRGHRQRQEIAADRRLEMRGVSWCCDSMRSPPNVVLA